MTRSTILAPRATNLDAHEITEMLAYRRPAWSKTEECFIRDFIAPLGTRPDAYGNHILAIGNRPNVLWSCHTDTVHKRAGHQRIARDAFGNATLGDNTGSNCLGADDTAGVWLMLEMIRAQTPGLYVFHRAEEIGGKGSAYIARSTPKLFDDIDCAIALDRKGTDSVITHQGTRCCSDQFANSLADLLGRDWRLDQDGIFTDTANYVNHVGECTNISVGYSGAHGPAERLNIDHLLTLRDTLCTLPQANLVIDRAPGDEDPDWLEYAERDPYVVRDAGNNFEEMIRLVRDNPLVVADMLEQMGYDASDIEGWIG